MTNPKPSAPRLSADQLRQILEDLPVFLYRMDREMRYTWVSGLPPGLQRTDIIGKTHWDVLPEAEAARLHDLRTQVLEAGEPRRAQISLTLGGRRRVHDTFMVPQYDAEGTVTGLVGASVDVTERQRAEDQLGRLVGAVEEYGIFMLDPGGRVLTWNEGAEKIKGYEKEEILGTHFSTFYTDEDRQEGRPEQLLEIAAREGHIETEGWRVRKDGSRFWARVTITALADEQDRLRGYVKVVRDMTERRERERQLTMQIEATERANRLLQLMQQVASTANRAESLEEALQEAVDAVCRHTGWPLGHVYAMGADGTLRSAGIWSQGSGERFGVFRRVTRQANFTVGESLPGRVAETKQPEWIEDVRNDERFIRQQMADDIAIKGAFAFPVLLEEEVLVVLEFFANAAKPRDGKLLEAMGSIGTQLARVAERQRASEQLRQSERRYRRLFEESQEGITITSPGGQIIAANPAALAITGYSEEDLPALNVQELYADPGARQKIRRMLAEQGAVRGFELPVRRKDGEVIICQVSSTLRKSAAGETEAFQTFFRDVTAAKRAQEALKESEEKFRTIAQNTPVGIGLVQDGVTKYVNPSHAAIFGYEVEELIGRPPETFVHPGDRDYMHRQIERRLAGETDTVHYQFRGLTKSGETRYVEVYGGRITYRDKPAVIGTLLDITDRRRLQQQVLEIQADERRRIGQELHDGIASQLTGIDMLFSSIIHDVEAGRRAEAEELREVQALIRDAADQTRRLSHGLTPAGISQGGLPKALRELAAMTERKSPAICSYEGPEELPESVSEEVLTHLYRIAQEAVNNAAKHAQSEHVWIHLSVSGCELALCVKDDGMGLPGDWKATAGIGLETMRHRTELLGGSMTIAGPPGGGTKLLLRVPIRASA